MSGPDTKNPIDAFREDTQNAEAAQAQQAGRSAADDIIEVVGDLAPKDPRNKHHCPKCGSDNMTTTRPLGGAPRNTCMNCAHKWLGGPRTAAKLVLSKNGPTQTQVAGPYYRGRTPLPQVDKHSPKSRRKSKSLAALKKKGE